MKTTGIIFACVACLLGGLAAGFNLQKGNARQTFISLKYGSNELKIDLDQDQEEVDSKTLLQQIFNDDFSRDGTKQWLKDSQQIYYFLDNDLVDEFAALPYDSEMSENLRGLRKRRSGPWNSPLDTIRIGVPKREEQPASGYCNACANKQYFGKSLRLYNLNDPTIQLAVQVNRPYECPAGLKFPDLQLNAADADSLLGSSIFDKYNKAMVIIVGE